MRKVKFELTQKYINLLKKVHEAIRQNVEDGNLQQAIDNLIMCQSKAIELGTLIEESEGLGFITVNHLEEYCEVVFAQSEIITSGAELKSMRIFKDLRNSLDVVEKSALSDIPVKEEVVFLPYKASMWDSLESVWEKADADPNVDAYVIPIPYFDKNTDGSFKEMHWEGDEYPKNVPITKYEDYDFGLRHPDKIYIHNPYDEFNFVTSVHPFFYAKNLCKMTDELIYIPYFVLAEPRLDNPDLRDNMAGFVFNSGVLYSNKVILQSENMKQAYIKLIVEEYGEEYRAEYEAKILGTGSPKIEKVLNLKKEDQEVPDEWKKIMYRPDGTAKKVIFYNTSVTALLKSEEAMITKMKDVFRVFEENKDDVALLWRPHPLIKATIESMRPQLWADYSQLVKEYKEAGWGIYDDSTDMDRAIALADAYYGDGSSIVQLCQERKMPVMIQNVEC